MSKTRRLSGIAAGALAAALVLSGCSDDGDGGGKERTGAVPPAALKNCGKVFGERNVEALRADLGEGFQPHDRSLTEMKQRMLVEAQGWNPDTDKLARTTFRPCQIEGRADGKEAWVNATAGWSRYDVAFVTDRKTRATSARWRRGSISPPRGVRRPPPDHAVHGPRHPGRTGRGAAAPGLVVDTDRTTRSVSTDQLLKALAESTRGCSGAPRGSRCRRSWCPEARGGAGRRSSAVSAAGTLSPRPSPRPATAGQEQERRAGDQGREEDRREAVDVQRGELRAQPGSSHQIRASDVACEAEDQEGGQRDAAHGPMKITWVRTVTTTPAIRTERTMSIVSVPPRVMPQRPQARPTPRRTPSPRLP
ncbi:hypothetical protein STANM309S_06666 [Streptomyces tanashiensis]